MENNKIPSLWGTGIILSDLSLEEVADIVSKKLFGGLPFGGKDRHIYEEVPAVFIDTPILGLLIILSTGRENSYLLHIEPYGEFGRYIFNNKIPKERVKMDLYLYHLLKQGLNGIPGIKVIEPVYE